MATCRHPTLSPTVRWALPTACLCQPEQIGELLERSWRRRRGAASYAQQHHRSSSSSSGLCKPHSDRCTLCGPMSVQSKEVVRRSIWKWSRARRACAVLAYLERRIPGIPAFTILSRYVHHCKGVTTRLHFRKNKIWISSQSFVDF